MSNSNSSAFDKQFKKSSQEIKSRIQKMITDGSTFCCMNMNISIEIPDTSPDAESNDKITLYSDYDLFNKWFYNLFKEELKTKLLNSMALEQMRLKGLEPKKQPLDILLIIIAPSSKKIHIAISIPKLFIEGFDFRKFVFSIIDNIRNENKNISIDNNINNNIDVDFTIQENMVFIDYKTDSEVKEIDNALTVCFKQLKAYGIYKDDEEDDEYVNYLEGMDD